MDEDTHRNIIKELDKPLDKSRIKLKQIGGRDDAQYLESYDVIDTANRIFGYGNWGITVTWRETREVGEKTVCMAAVMLQVRDCMMTEDVGMVIARQTKGEALMPGGLEMAWKGAVSDAMKRCFRQFGNQFGNSLYAKETITYTDKARWKTHGYPKELDDPGQIKGVPDLKEREAAPDAETLRGWIHERVKEKDLYGEISEPQIGLLNGLLTGIFGSDEMAERQRHQLLDFMFQVLSSKKLTKGQASALIDWAKDSVGNKPHPVAVAEGQMVVTAHEVEAGQAEFQEEPK